MIRVEPDIAEKLKRTRGQIAAGRVEDRIVIGKRHVFEPWRRHVFVKSGPAAIVALETKLPSKCATKDCIQRLWVCGPYRAQRHQHHRCVVGVWIMNVVVLK